MVDVFYGFKQESTSKYAQNGGKICVTKIKLYPGTVNQIKTQEKDGYSALKIKIGRFFREIKAGISDLEGIKVGDELKAGSVFTAGDVVKVTGISKGKGFQGVVKRWGFRGGPITHGQSDRQRHPGSIGQRSTPGRVYKGKHMGGRMGGQTVAVKGLRIMSVNDDEILVSGVVPGGRNRMLTIAKMKANKPKKFIPLMEKDGKLEN